MDRHQSDHHGQCEGHRREPHQRKTDVGLEDRIADPLVRNHQSQGPDPPGSGQGDADSAGGGGTQQASHRDRAQQQRHHSRGCDEHKGKPGTTGEQDQAVQTA